MGFVERFVRCRIENRACESRGEPVDAAAQRACEEDLREFWGKFEVWFKRGRNRASAHFSLMCFISSTMILLCFWILDTFVKDNGSVWFINVLKEEK